MRIHVIGFIALLSVYGSASATQSQPPSNASIHSLLEATQAHKTIDAMVSQMDGLMRKSMQQAIGPQKFDAGEQKIMDGMINQLNDLMKQQLAWKKLEPMYIDLYRKTFTQKEVDDMLTFDRSPSGRSMIAKMPALVAASMQTMQGEMKTLMPQLQKISQETASRLEAYDAKKKDKNAQSEGHVAAHNK